MYRSLLRWRLLGSTVKERSSGENDMWYVIWTITRNEQDVLDWIGVTFNPDKYLRAWIPQKKVFWRDDGVKSVKLKPAFPGYVFIDTADPQYVHERLRGYSNYIGVLKNSEGYAPVSESEQRIISHFTGEDGAVDMSLGVIINGELNILDGPLKGMENRIVKINRHHRTAYVKFDRLLGEERILTFGLEVVEKN